MASAFLLLAVLASTSAYTCTTSSQLGWTVRQRSSKRIPLFSSEQDETPTDVPDISVSQEDIDFMSVHDIDWGEMVCTVRRFYVVLPV